MAPWEILRSRTASIHLVLLLLLIGSALPASATHQQSTAALNARDVAAGTSSARFNLTVLHPAGTGSPIDWVLIIPPQSASGDPLISATGGSAPGWSGLVVEPPPSVVYTGSTIAPGSSATFEVLGETSRPAADQCGAWRILVSSDGGANAFEARGAQSESLTTCLRVVEVATLGLESPFGARDGIVTAGQSNTCARIRLQNRGSAGAVVVSELRGSGFTATAPRAVIEGASPCEGPLLTDGEIDVAAGGTADVDFGVAFDATPGTAALRAGAVGPTAKALERSLDVEIQPRAQLQYASETLQPRAVRPGQQGVAFSLSLLKGPEGSPSLRFDTAATSFTAPGCSASALTYPTELVTDSATQMVFEPCEIAPASDGLYDVSLSYRFVDSNGHVMEDVLPGIERLRIDGLVPSGSVSMSAPAGQPGVKNGDRVTLSGSFVDYDPEARNFVPCGNCAVQIFLRQYAEPNCSTQIGGLTVMSAVNSGGAVSESYTGTFVEGARGLLAQMLVMDEALNSSFIASTCMLVDNEPPFMVQALTTRSGLQQNNMVKVTFSECVVGRIELFDFRVTNNVVTEWTQPACSLVSGSYRTVVTLTTILPFPDDNPTGMVSYEPLVGVGGSLRDGVGNVMAPHEVPVQDGISG